MGCLRQIVPKAIDPRQHPFHIAIQNRLSAAKAQGRDGRSGRWTDTRELLKALFGVWKNTAMRTRHHLRTTVQIFRTTVITQTAPQAQHLIQTGTGQGRDCWETA